MEIGDLSVVEAASWRMASELVRRHPTRLRMIRAHPGGGLSDCLWLLPAVGDQGDVRLNRNGTIQILERFDGRPPDGWGPVEWSEYLFAEPRAFLGRLEHAAGLTPSSQVPAATPRTLTYRVLAAIAATGFKTVRPIEIEQGYIDTSGYGCGPNPNLDVFPIDNERLRGGPDDLLDEARYRFWIVVRDHVPVVAIDQADAVAWVARDVERVDLMSLYEKTGRSVVITALELLRRVEDAT